MASTHYSFKVAEPPAAQTIIVLSYGDALAVWLCRSGWLDLAG